MLHDVRVLELSLFSPDALGGHLADLGAQVIKIEPPGGGGFRGELFPPDNVQNLQWNRGKKSVTLNLKSEEGAAIFRRLTAGATVVIDGLRAGAAERLGFGYADVVELNPTIVYCSLNGMGSYGPYAKLPTHGLSFDCFAGLNPPLIQADGTPRLSAGATGTTGVLAGPLYAAMAVLAALHCARRDGQPQYVEVSQVDAAIAWNFQKLTALGNDLFGYQTACKLRCGTSTTRPATATMWCSTRWKTSSGTDSAKPRTESTSMSPVGRVWATIRNPTSACAANSPRSSRAALVGSGPNSSSPPILRVHRRSRAATSLRTNTSKLAAWFMNRAPIAEPPIQLIATPIKRKPDHPFAAALPPAVGAHTDEVLATLAGCDEAELVQLRRDGVI